MSALLVNWLAIEPLLVARVKAQAPKLRAVYTAAELAALEVPSDPRASAMPAAHILWAGDQLVQTDPNGDIEVLDQIWCVAIVAKNDRGADALRAEVGPLLSQVMAGVSGWDCDLPGIRPFRPARISNMPRFNANQKAIFPLFFAARAFV